MCKCFLINYVKNSKITLKLKSNIDMKIKYIFAQFDWERQYKIIWHIIGVELKLDNIK